jgi:hypothetical protein
LIVDHGWPTEDYDLIANERPMTLTEHGKLTVDFYPTAGDDMEVHNVKWITILRHPYSRSLSHYAHMLAVNRSRQEFTLPNFLADHSRRPPYHFNRYIPNQQTRWHCASFDCHFPRLGPEHLVKAISILEQFHVVLILEDMKDPDSCTRIQMRHVLNLTKVEILEDLSKANSSKAVTNLVSRRSHTDWYKDYLAQFTSSGQQVDNLTSAYWGNESLQIMAVLGVYNDIDLQLYGYARKLCTDRAEEIKRNQQSQLLSQQSERIDFEMRQLVELRPGWMNAAVPLPNNTAWLFQLLSFAIIFLLMMPIIWPWIQRRRRIRIKKECVWRTYTS